MRSVPARPQDLRVGSGPQAKIRASLGNVVGNRCQHAVRSPWLVSGCDSGAGSVGRTSALGLESNLYAHPSFATS